MIRSPRRTAFTLIEMITVIAIIVILVSLVIAINGLVQRKAAASRADGEIKALSGACEAYKTDNGGYPQDTTAGSTSKLDPTQTAYTSPTTYLTACSFLYVALSGDTNANGILDPSEKGNTNYAPDFFKTARLAGSGSVPYYILDPYGNSYGYSTAGLQTQQEYMASLSTNPGAAKPTRNQAYGTIGYNNTFDMWSTGGTTGTGSADTAKWIKNW
jgi:prepilin-type N-terminal cleavage/methylation domain-containing protein